MCFVVFIGITTVVVVYVGTVVVAVCSVLALCESTLLLLLVKDCMYAGCHKKVYIWRIMDNFEQITTELDTDHGTIYALAVSKKYLIIGTQNQNIHIHDIGTHQYLQSLNGHISTVTCLLVSPCERVLFSGSKDSSIQVWSLENLLPIRSLQRHEKCVCSLALSKDTLFSCSEDTEIKLYKVYKM
jgi:E3 ubiquitin-protein ligase TRAF7